MSLKPQPSQLQSWAELSVDQAAEKLASLSVDNMEKQAMPEMLQQLYSKLQDAGNSAKDWYLAQDPTVQWSIPGAAIGGAAGGLSSYGNEAEERQTLRDILLGATAGGAVGAGAGLLSKYWPNGEYTPPAPAAAGADAPAAGEGAAAGAGSPAATATSTALTNTMPRPDLATAQERLQAAFAAGKPYTGWEADIGAVTGNPELMAEAAKAVDAMQAPATREQAFNAIVGGTLGGTAGTGIGGAINYGARRILPKLTPQNPETYLSALQEDARGLLGTKTPNAPANYIRDLDDLAKQVRTSAAPLSRTARMASKARLPYGGGSRAPAPTAAGLGDELATLGGRAEAAAMLKALKGVPVGRQVAGRLANQPGVVGKTVSENVSKGLNRMNAAMGLAGAGIGAYSSLADEKLINPKVTAQAVQNVANQMPKR